MVELKHISYKENNKIANNKLDCFSANLPDYGLISLSGENIEAKTAFIDILSGQKKPTTGMIEYNGLNIVDSRSMADYRKFFVLRYNKNFFNYKISIYDFIAEFCSCSSIQIECSKIKGIIKENKDFSTTADKLSDHSKLQLLSILIDIKRPKLIIFDDDIMKTSNNEFKKKIIALSDSVLIINSVQESSETHNIINFSYNNISFNTDNNVISANKKEECHPEFKKETTIIRYFFRHHVSLIQILMLFMSIISFALFGSAESLGSYSTNLLIEQESLKANPETMLLTPDDPNKELTDAEINSIEKETDSKIAKVILANANHKTLRLSECTTYDLSNQYIASLCTEVTKFITLDEYNHLSLSYKLQAGSFPTKNNEIVISDYQLLTFESFGYNLNGTTINTDIIRKDPSILIGKDILYRGLPHSDDSIVKISGILTTGLINNDLQNKIDSVISAPETVPYELATTIISRAEALKSQTLAGITIVSNNIGSDILNPLHEALITTPKNIKKLKKKLSSIENHCSIQEIAKHEFYKSDTYNIRKNLKQVFLIIGTILLLLLIVMIIYDLRKNTGKKIKNIFRLYSYGIDESSIQKQAYFLAGLEAVLQLILGIIIQVSILSISNSIMKLTTYSDCNLISVNMVTILITLILCIIATVLRFIQEKLFLKNF